MSSSASRLRRALVASLLGLATVLATAPGSPAAAASDDPDLSVGITSLSPTHLVNGSRVRMAGTVTNNNTFTWTDVQAYLVIAHAPFTSRSQLSQAVSSSTAYTGERVVDLGSIDDLGTLDPRESRTFTLDVAYSKLGLTGADGVYPVGVQILGTDATGHRSASAIGRATTFLPRVSSTPSRQIPLAIGWTFRLDDYRGSDGNWADPKHLMSEVTAGGRLRNLLDLASTTAGRSTVVLDPALLVAVDDLAHGRNLRSSVHFTTQERDAAAAFRDDLVRLARQTSLWVVGYDRPDELALSRAPDLAHGIDSSVDQATDAVLSRFGLSGRRVSWPTSGGVSNAMLADVRGPGDQPVIVSSSDLKSWSSRDGSVVSASTSRGPVPLLVDDGLLDDVPGTDSVVTVRQWLAGQSALAALSQSLDQSSKADAIVLVDPAWNPGAQWRSGRLSLAFDLPWVSGGTYDDLIQRATDTSTVTLTGRLTAKTVDRAQLTAASAIRAEADSLKAVYTDSTASSEELAELAASAASVRWRTNRSTGLASAEATLDRAEKQLDAISLEGPQSVTLSGNSGRFPLTISNKTSHAIKVGVRLDSSNPALSVPDVKAVTIDAGERHTLNVDVDLGEQKSTYVTAQLLAPGGETFGTSSVFSVRSSKVGVVLWCAIGLAGLLVVATLLRRFRKRRSGLSPAQDVV